MALFIFLSADALDKKFASRARGLGTERSPGPGHLNLTSVRRPYRGIQIKEDTYATLSIINGNGDYIPLVSESATIANDSKKRGSVADYADFIIQSVDDQRVEKQQIIETFGDSFVFFFGERPRMVTFSGVLMNTEDFNWKAQLDYNYEHFLRGTKLVQRNARAFLSYDTRVVEGYPINIRISDSADNPYHVQFQMTMFVTNAMDYSSIGSTDFPKTTEALGMDAANAQLEELRVDSVSAEVRSMNIQSGATGLAAWIRARGRDINSGLNVVSNWVQIANTIASGRIVRVPIGVAGFVAQAGQAALAATGTSFADLNFAGSGVKLMAPKGVEFAPIDPKKLRTRISANTDEYPLQPEAKHVSLPGTLDAEREGELLRTAAALEATRVGLIAQNMAAEATSDVLQVAADVVNFARTGFALVAGVRAAVVDPGAVAADLLGLTGLLPTAFRRDANGNPITTSGFLNVGVANPLGFRTDQGISSKHGIDALAYAQKDGPYLISETVAPLGGRSFTGNKPRTAQEYALMTTPVEAVEPVAGNPFTGNRAATPLEAALKAESQATLQPRSTATLSRPFVGNTALLTNVAQEQARRLRRAGRR